MEYKNNDFFLNGVKENDLNVVKSQLSEMIMLYQGDKNEIMQAVKYAKNNCSFEFEEHHKTEISVDKTSNSDLFYTEKVELQNNFSKERLEKVISLYPLMVKEDDFFAEDEKKLEKINSKQVGFNLDIKSYLILGASIIVAGYIIYRILK